MKRFQLAIGILGMVFATVGMAAATQAGNDLAASWAFSTLVWCGAYVYNVFSTSDQ
jgi:hypothetical protein